MNNKRPNRNRLVTVRFTQEEFQQIEAMAHTAKVELSAFIRFVLVRAVVPARAQGRSPNIAALGKILVALNKIGGNINQIAREAHITGNVVAYQEAEKDRDRLAEAARAVMDALK